MDRENSYMAVSSYSMLELRTVLKSHKYREI